MKNQKFTDEDFNTMYDYIKGHWYDHEGYSDLNLFLDEGYIDLAVRCICDSGAINSKLCYEYAKDTEKLIERFNKTLKQKDLDKQLNECLEGVEVWVNELNEHWFIDRESHFVTDEELQSWGFKKENYNE